MTWNEVAKDHLAAARMIVHNHPRSAISRAYYAAHCALTQQLQIEGYLLPLNRQTPPHREQSRLARLHLKNQRIPTLITRLYAIRLDADYNLRATVDSGVAMDSIRYASEMFRLLRVEE